MKTTPPRKFDVTEKFPWLRDMRRKVIRLHPRQVTSSLPPAASKMGWPFLWPEEEPWPVCGAKMVPEQIASFERALERSRNETSIADLAKLLDCSVEEVRVVSESGRENTLRILEQGRNGHNEPYLAVLQLRQDDFPELPYPPSKSIFQLLWCPTIHFDPRQGPGHLIFWRNESEIRENRADPIPEGSYGSISECSLDPERITDDLPSYFELRDDHGNELVTLFDSWTDYERDHGPTPGTKLFGCGEWVQHPEIPACPGCGSEMLLLVTIASYELDRQRSRWTPLEDRDLLEDTVQALWSADHGPTRVARFHQWQALQVPHSLMIGDGGNAYLFYCLRCPEQPMVSVVQSS